MSNPIPPPAWASFAAIEQAAPIGRAQRIARGEIMTYVLNGWVVREFPGGRIDRLAPAATFRAEDFPYPA
jgi:hypothetical protein